MPNYVPKAISRCASLENLTSRVDHSLHVVTPEFLPGHPPEHDPVDNKHDAGWHEVHTDGTPAVVGSMVSELHGGFAGLNRHRVVKCQIGDDRRCPGPGKVLPGQFVRYEIDARRFENLATVNVIAVVVTTDDVAYRLVEAGRQLWVLSACSRHVFRGTSSPRAAEIRTPLLH